MISLLLGRRTGWATLAVIAALLLLIGASLAPGGASAATCNVTNEATLRAALADVTCDPINITAPGTITLDAPAGSVTEIYIGRNVTINNTSGGLVTLAGGPNQRQILMINATVTINGGTGGLTISGGDPAPGTTNGGGILNLGSLTLTNATVRDNTSGSATDGYGGGIFNQGTLALNGTTVRNNTIASTANGFGGGIFNTGGSVTLTNSSVVENAVTTNPGRTGLGGGIYNDSGTVILNGSTIADNDAVYGGGIYSYDLTGPASLTLTNSTVSGNTASSGGGIYTLASGGYATTFTMTGGSISGNTATGTAADSCRGGGGLNNVDGNGTATATLTNVTISGNGAANSEGGGIRNCAGSLHVSGGSIAANTTSGGGGGIYSYRGTTTITGTTIGGPLPANANHALTGGGILNIEGPLSLTDSAVRGNVAAGWGGGLHNTNNTAGRTSTATLTRTTVAGNQATAGEGGVANVAWEGVAEITFTNSTLSDNVAPYAAGLSNNSPGSVASTGTARATFTNSTVSDNRATIGTSGGIGNTAWGGTAILTMTGGQISGNSAAITAPAACFDGGGGLYNSGPATATLTNVLVSENATTGSFSNGGGLYNCDGTLTLNGGTVTKNQAVNSGGGIYNYRGTTRITGATIGGPSTADGNTALNGAGVFTTDGSLELTESAVRGNTAGGNGGGISNIAQTAGRTASATLTRTTVSENTAGSGGAIDNVGGGGIAALTITASTINGNRSTPGTAGIRNQGFAASTVTATIINSTLANNSGDNGALMVITEGTGSVSAALTNVTIAGNTATTTGFGAGLQIRDRGAVGGTASVTLRNSILAGSTGPNVALIGPGASLTSGGRNVSDDASGAGVLTGPGDINGQPAGLDPAGLQANGGPTRTVDLQPGSPAIDRVPASGANCPATDQRGEQRPQGLACDSGALEVTVIATSLTAAPATGVYGGTVTLSATLTRGGVPVANQTITFRLNGTPAGTATTNAGGVAALTNASLGTIPAGSYPAGVGASFAGSGPYRASSATAALTIARAATTTTANNASASYGNSATLTATIANTSPGSTALVNEGTVNFVVTRGAQTLCTATSATVGNGSATASCALGGANAGNATITATYSGGPNVLPSADTATLTITRRILWVKPQDRTVGLRQPNPPTVPPAGCAAQATPTAACWLELANGSTFAPGDDWSDLNLTQVRFAYSRTGTGPANEQVGARYRITALGVLSTNYDVRYQTGTLTVVQP